VRQGGHFSGQGCSEGAILLTASKPQRSLSVDRSSQQRIFGDDPGKFWLLSPGDDPWDERVPFEPTKEMDLERTPGHYTEMLGLPS